MLCEYAEPSLTRGGSLCVHRGRVPLRAVVKFGEIWRNLERETAQARTEGFPGYVLHSICML